MLKESIKSPIFTDGFRLIDLLCQSYPPHCVVLRLELSEWLWKKSHREQPIVRLAMCERSSLGLPHTQNRMSGRPRVAEILLMRSPKTLRVRGDLSGNPWAAMQSQYTLSWQCSRSTTNAISELLLFCVYVCVMRYIFISVLFSLGVRGVCVLFGYEDRIHFGRILEELWVVWTRIESIIWSFFTVTIIDYRFRFLQSILSP